MNRKGRVALALSVFAFTVVPIRGVAQDARVLTGAVMEAGGRAPVAGAIVRIDALERSVITGADGRWQLGGLAPGRYELIVEHIGYAPARVALDTHAGEAVRIELTPRPLPLSAMVVTASRRPQQLRNAPVATELLDRAELRRSGASDLAAVLVERTGVSVQAGHPVGAGVMLQGLGSERVLVLMDGQPLQGRISGTLDLSRVPVSMIERVEIVKGPQSTLYGSDAMGGVVNIVTRVPQHDGWQLGADVTSGSRNRLDVAVNALGGAGPLGYTIDGGRRSIELVPGHSGEAATYATRFDGAAKVEWRRDSTSAVSAGAVFLDESQRWRTGALYSFADNLQWTGRMDAVIRRGVHRFSPTLYATEFRHLARRSTQPTPVSDSGEQEIQRLLEAEVLYGYDAGGVAIDAGIEARREAIESDRVSGATRTLHAVEPFVQGTLGRDDWSIVPGVRLAWSEQWGTHVTPRLALLFRPAPGLALRAAVGQGYRAPSFKELYMDFLNTAPGAGYRVRGNPQLQPETSRNVSGSVEWSGDRVYARVQTFYNRFDDFIETAELAEAAGVRVFTYGNIEDGVTWGSEVELGASWRALRAEAGYGYLVAEDRSTGQSLFGRPRHSGRASLTWARASGLRLTLGAVHTGRTLVSRTDAGDVFRSGFSRVDVRASQHLPHGFELSAGIDNVSDARPAQWPGFVGRQVHINLGWQAEGRR